VLKYSDIVTAERWRQIEEIFNSALECPPEQRGAFLTHACKGDDELRKEIEDLVLREESPGWKLPEHPAWVTPEPPAGPFAPGTRLGPYEIVEAIGAGGMGLVFRAIDTRLGRSVAIKTSREPLSDRFEREARTIASLNHPNICTLYDTGPDYLVMELIEGPTLADRLRKGPLALDEALNIARQIAAALEAAHEKGIVHRDLKPANIKFRPDGSVKVLDFGLAKSGAESEPSADSIGIRLSGLILGTAAYMSPEQALGQDLDKRSDIWAFGVVLYEMLAGCRPFAGATASDCLAAVVQREPDLTEVPFRVRRLVDLCLEKDPRKRLRDLGDWEHLLDPEPSQPAPPAASPWRKIAWVAIPALLAAAVAVGALSFRPATPARATRFQVSLPENVYFQQFVSVSPDGQNLAFTATGEQGGLWIHNLDTLAWRRLPGTELARTVFWSPDSRFLAFTTRDWNGSEVKKIDTAGGPPVAIYSTSQGRPLYTGAWNRNGDMVFGGFAGFGKLPAGGGADTPLTSVDRARGEVGHAYPAFLPDGKHFIYLIAGPASVAGMYAGSVDDRPGAQPRQRILAARSAAVYTGGRLLYLRDDTLMAQPFDAGRLSLVGSPVPLAEHVQAIGWASVFSASPAVLAYRSGTASLGRQLTWLDRQGNEIGAVGEPNSDNDIKLSPDQTSAAMVGAAENSTAPDIWLIDFARGTRTRLTFDLNADSPVWSPDGSRIFFSSGPKLETISWKAAGGAGSERELLKEPGRFHYPTSISPDGHFLIYFTMPKRAGPGVPGQVWALPLATHGQPIHLLGSQFSENRAAISPDGRWIAYRSNESGKFEVYVRSVVTSDSGRLSLGEGKWQASRDSGEVPPALPIWSHDSRELFYMSSQEIIFSVPVDGSHASQPLGSPSALFTAPCSCGFDVSADGRRFLVRGEAGAGAKMPITVVLNWQAELKGR